MAAVRTKNTAPEIVVRRLLHGMGFRFRVHRRDLTGNPDIVLPRLRKVIFVHGCFWHGHEGCRRGTRPESNISFWNSKIDRNTQRDEETQRALSAAGWEVFVVWQCQLKDMDKLRGDILDFLGSTQRTLYR